ncbi:hypothetical protein P9112_001626 [Eukaryota sp. TZLM1-RC]
MVEGRIKKTRLVRPAISSHQVPAQIEETEPSPEPHQSEVPASPGQPMESTQPPMETGVVPPMDTSTTCHGSSRRLGHHSDAVPAPITPVSRVPLQQPTPSTIGSVSTTSSHQSPFSGTYDSSLLLSSMIGSRDRDDRRGNRPKRPYLEAADLRNADKLLKFVNKFILWSRTDRVLKETRGNVEDPAQIALAR